MRQYLPRAVAKEVRGGKALFLLAVAGVALGVASVLSIQLLDASALGAFSGTVKAVSGDADLSVLPWAGALDEALLDEVLAVPGVAAAAPVFRADVAVDGRPGVTLELAGVDLVSPRKGPRLLDAGVLEAALGTPGWVAVSSAWAAEQGWRAGDRIGVSLGSRRATLVIGAIVELERVAPLASRRLAIMDLAQAQGLLGGRGRLHEIAVRATPGVSPDALAERLAARLGGRGRVATAAQRTVEAEGLLGAFRLNLTALSLVSLLVGGFLVYASVRASVARRREELGVLRAVGATRAQVVGLVLGEAAVLGALGTAAGIPLGWLAARANVAAVSGTVRNLYLLEGIEGIALTPGLALLGVVTGIGGAVAGALWPAVDAGRTDPRALLASISLEERVGAGAARLLAAGLAVLAASAAIAAATARRWAPAGFVLAVGVLVAVPLAAPAALRVLTRLPRPRRLGVREGARRLGTRLSAAAPAAGALAVAVAMLVGVTVMVGSFRTTVVRWLDATLRSDVYVSTPSWRRARSEATLGPEVIAALRALPGATVAVMRQHAGFGAGRRILVSGVDAALPAAGRRVALVGGGDGAAAMAALRRGAVLVSEPLARKAGLDAGSTLALRARDGEVTLPIAGVYRDYGTEGGAVLLDVATYARLYGPGLPSNASVDLPRGADPEAAVRALRAALPGAPLLIRSNRTLRGEVLAIFEQTFAITRLLEAMGLLIAAAGVTLALLVLARERRGELALYRALGATRGQLFRVFLGRGLAVGAAGLVLGAAGGWGLALILVKAVNPAFFGWTLEVAVPWATLAGEAAAILAAAAAASLYPAVAASATPAQELSRDAL
ncbi:FtsX-like permease family protein [Anaeromyxobacter oryzisoli]|uniref:FtsX-like permease family protein n=1 Tax=Anaeromyxobacter oryzisoli TaxID=2925408 RepID=UPI001F5ABFE6|nr:FtsX-like permease family protein [Anaeromyxobacter sp. SG63]